MKKYLFLVLLLTACGDDNPVESSNPSLTGNWFGSSTSNSNSSTLTMLLTETETVVIGSGTQFGFDSNPAFTVSGINIYPDISLSLIRTGKEDMNYTGKFTNPNTITGMWIRPLSSIPITLVRQ